MGGKSGIKDPRFVTEHAGDAEFSLVTRSSDGQLLFLASMISKMKHDTPLGSRIAEVHNGSSLFAEAIELESDSRIRRAFLIRLQGEIEKRGVIDVMRHGISHGQHTIELFYGTPSPDNTKATEQHAANIFTVTRQLH